MQLNYSRRVNQIAGGGLVEGGDELAWRQHKKNIPTARDKGNGSLIRNGRTRWYPRLLKPG